jgi:hypothetical protein
MPPESAPATSAAAPAKRKHLLTISMPQEQRAVATLKGMTPEAFAEEAVAEKVSRMRATFAKAAALESSEHG